MRSHFRLILHRDRAPSQTNGRWRDLTPQKTIFDRILVD